MTKVAMILGHDLLIPNEDTRVYREALSLVKAGYGVTVFCWSRRTDKYETEWDEERDGIQVVRVFQELSGGFFSKVRGFRKAMKQLQEKVIEYEPDYLKAYITLGNAQLLLGKLDQAKATYETALLKHPEVAGIHKNLGIIYSQKNKNPSKAISHFQEYLRLSPNQPDVAQIQKLILKLTR